MAHNSCDQQTDGLDFEPSSPCVGSILNKGTFLIMRLVWGLKAQSGLLVSEMGHCEPWLPLGLLRTATQ